MTYQEIYDSVVSFTDREDLAAEIQAAIQAATLRIHQSDYYVRDLAEDLIQFSGSDNIHAVSISATFPRFRAFHYLRKWDNVGQAAGAFLDHLGPEQAVDTYGSTRTDVYYVAGNTLNIRSNGDIEYVLAGWYQNPRVTPVNQYSSWIADAVPHAIIFDASSIIFQMTAHQEQSRKFDALVAEQVALVKMQGLLAKGY